MKKVRRLAALVLSAVLLLTTVVQGLASDGVATITEEAWTGYTVSLETAEHGALSFTGSDADVREAGFEEGETVSVTAEPAEGYTLATVSLLDEDGVFIQTDDEIQGTYDEDTGITEFSFLMPACDVYIYTTFALYPEEYSDEYLEEMEENLLELESAEPEEDSGDAEAMDISLESYSLATYSLTLTASSTTYFSRGTNHKYFNYSTYEGRATWEGTSCITYCVEPSKNTPSSGTYSVSEWNSTLARAACYYGYGGPGYMDSTYGMYYLLFGGDSSNSNIGFAYAYSHMAISWIYDGMSSDSDAFKGVTSSGTISAIKNLVNTWNTSACLATIPSGFKVYTFNYGSSSTQTECFFYNEPNGKVYVKKVSSNTTITSSNSAYSLAGAKYQIFRTEAEAKAAATGSDSNNTARIATLTTDSSGNTNQVELAAGTYYIKEIVASKGYQLDTNVYSVTVSSGGTSCITSTEVPYTGSLKVYKYSSDNSTTDGNSAYSLASGATFGVYTDSACSGTAAATVTLNQYDSTNKRAYGTASNLPYGTYYVKELTAPTGFYTNSEIKSVVVGSTTAEAGFSLSFWDEPIKVTIELTKETDLDSVAVMKPSGQEATDEEKANELALHEDYSLEGAEYGIYSDKACTKLLDTITTDADGKGTGNIELAMGTYYAKEITAPEGYELSDEVYTITADSTVVSASNTTVEVTVSDPPDLGKVIVYKSSSDSSFLEDYPDYYSLEGAVYTVYYECNDNVCSRPAGTITINEDGYGELKGILYSGDDTYVYVKETSAPANFSIDTEVHKVKLTADNDVGIVKSTDTPKTRTFYVYKGPLAMLETGSDFDADIKALAESEGKTLTKIVFTNSKKPSSSTTTIDVSYAQNGGIIAWMDGTTCYVSDVPAGKGDDAGLIYFNYNSSYMFQEMTDLVSIDFGSGVIDTSYVTQMNWMFDYLPALKTLDVSEFNTQNVTSMYAMFQIYYRSAEGTAYANSSLTSITGLDTLNTSNCTNMAAMFRGCNKLTSIDISNFDTSKVLNMDAMFQNCNSLTSLDLTSFNVGNVTSMDAMFTDCTSMKYITITGWNTSKVTNMTHMFGNCSSLINIVGLSNISTLHVTACEGMFINCSGLISQMTWRCSTTTSYENMFTGCSTISGRSFTLYGTSATATLAQNMVATKSAASNVSYGGAVALTDTSSSVMTASADTGILSGIRSALPGIADSVTETVSENMSLASIADKLGMVTEAQAEETELDLDDAVYMAFLDSEFEEEYRKFDFDHYQTDSNGETTAVFALTGVPYGLTIYVKETMPATNYGLDENTWSFSASDASLKYVTSVDPQDTNKVYIAMEKTLDTDQDLTGTEYSMEGIVYNVYTDANCTTPLYYDMDGDGVKDEAYLKLSANGISNTIGPIDIGTATEVTYYIKEDAATLTRLKNEGKSTGIKLDTGSHSLTAVKDEKTTLYFEVEDDIVSLGSLIVNKRSSDTSVGANDGENYSYEGAQFTVYTDASLSEASVYDVIETNSAGRGTLSNVQLGTYYIKETKAPKGYELSTDVYKAEVVVNSSGSASTTKYYKLNTSTGAYEEYSTGTFTAYDNPVKGTLEIVKYSANTSVTSGNSSYSLEGAVFNVYKSDGTTVYTTLTTDADGHASVSGLPLGTYYVKETTASKGFKVNSTSYEAVLTSTNVSDGKTYTVPVAETPNTVTLSIVKASADPDATDGNANYTLEGAVFGIFSDEECTTCISTMTTDADGKAASKDLAVGTYYIQEMQAPEGFELDSAIYKAVCTASSVTYTNLATGVSGSSLLSGGSLSITEDIETGKIRVYKESDDRDLTEYLDSYTLEGAVYGVYASEDDATNDVVGSDGTGTLGLGYLTTDEYGETEYLEGLAYGTYYVKETLAPDGFELDTATYTVDLISTTVDAEYAVELAVTDTASYTPTTLRIMKESAQEDAPGPLSGAQFVIQYYDGSYSTQDEIQVASPATRFWVIETKEVDGEYVAELTDEYLLDGSDDLFYDKDGNVILPVGTYTIYESLAPDLYSEEGNWYDSDGDVLSTLDTLEGYAILLQVKQDENTGAAYIEATACDESSGDEWTVTLTEDSDGFVTLTKEDMALGSITIIKQDEDGNLLEGVTYSLYKYNELTDDYEFVVSATTGSDGTALFDELEYGTYKVVETSTLSGLTLLAEPIIVTIPVEISIEEAEELGADIGEAYLSADGTTCYFVDLTYTITDSPLLSMPLTGTQVSLPITLGAGLAIFAFAMAMLLKRKRVVK